jgi:hypothetical protein
LRRGPLCVSAQRGLWSTCLWKSSTSQRSSKSACTGPVISAAMAYWLGLMWVVRSTGNCLFVCIKAVAIGATSHGGFAV